MSGFSTESVKTVTIAITIALILVMANDTLASLVAAWARH